ILAQPIIGADGQVHAVITAAREGRRPPFTEVEPALLAAFARFAAPFLDQLSTHVEAQAVLEVADDGLFRREAIEAQALPRYGDVIRVSPSWVSWAYWALVALVVASLVYVSVGTVSTYSAGPAIVRSTTRSEVVARTSGNVTEVLVTSGNAVEPGAVIARLDDTDARGAVERIEREFDAQLRNHLLDPSDLAADGALRTLRLQLDQARGALEDRVIRAESHGVIADVRVRPGQRVEPGNVVSSIVDGSAELSLIALLPGSDRPQLEPGMSLRLELVGYRYSYQTVTIDSVSTDVLGPGEARRVLGVEIAESLPLPPSVVLVRARIPSHDFVVDGERFRYHDGMLARAQVRVREERILYTLIPELRRM
ncbi:MAG: HlyD family efflux transporter periplasmic adaptor subunit, partial [Deltaproteobacteria bacterium]|nr:HlyD family efflux transporter periplasmic adaptor subunit [Kofleriaceae bacterium]